MNENKFDFENLHVYQKALDYVDMIYEITKIFPKSEAFSLVDQFEYSRRERRFESRVHPVFEDSQKVYKRMYRLY